MMGGGLGGKGRQCEVAAGVLGGSRTAHSRGGQQDGWMRGP